MLICTNRSFYSIHATTGEKVRWRCLFVCYFYFCFFFITNSKNASQAPKDPKPATTIYLFDSLRLTLLAVGSKGAFRGVPRAYWKICLIPVAQPSGNNITHTERSWCQGQLSCKRWGRWETCIDFSFCWGKQACCGWARVQWGRHNALVCSSSFSPVSCDCRETPWKQLSRKTTKILSTGAFSPLLFLLIFFSLLTCNTEQMLQVITRPITLFKAKTAGWREFWPRIQRGNSASITPDRDEAELAIAHHAGPRRAEMLVKHMTWCHRSQTHPSSAALA